MPNIAPKALKTSFAAAYAKNPRVWAFVAILIIGIVLYRRKRARRPHAPAVAPLADCGCE